MIELGESNIGKSFNPTSKTMSDPYSTPSAAPCNPILHLVLSIIMTCFCCMPAGIAGIIFSILSKGDLDAGRTESAVKNSKIAMWCNLGGLAVGVICVVLYLIFVGLLVASSGA